MKQDSTLSSNKRFPLLICIASVFISSAVLFAFKDLIGYRSASLILLLVVSVIAMLADILPVIISALLSALIWNFFFIPPLFTFHINETEDLLMFLLYFAVAVLNAVLTFKIRKANQHSREKEDKEKTIRLYNTMFNSLSHELRTPVATIIGSVDTLKDQKDKLSSKSQSELLNEIGIASLRLNDQVGNLLNMSRLESGILQLKPDWTDLSDLQFTLVKSFEDIKNSRTINIILPEQLPLIKIDSWILRQILHNIVQNAIRYTPSNAIINISSNVIEDSLIVEISDNGDGIPKDQIPHLFQKFYRVAGNESGGLGLGLSIAKGFSEALNGTISAYNNSNGGATFTITIPVVTSYMNQLKND